MLLHISKHLQLTTLKIMIMRQIEKEMLQAIKEKRNFSKSNTIVKHENSTVYVYLFGIL